MTMRVSSHDRFLDWRLVVGAESPQRGLADIMRDMQTRESVAQIVFGLEPLDPPAPQFVGLAAILGIGERE